MCFRLCSVFIFYFVCCLIVWFFFYLKRGLSFREIEKLIGKVLKVNVLWVFMFVNKFVVFEEFINLLLLDLKNGNLELFG